MKQATIPGCDALIRSAVPTDWRPDEMPSLEGIHELGFDTETDGLKWWAGNRPVGLSIAHLNMDLMGNIRPGPRLLPKEAVRTAYLPWAQKGGGNHDEAVMKRWCQRELRNKLLVGLNIRFDAHMMREWGVDLEAQGCTFRDVGHSAAILDDNRYAFSLESIAQDILGEGKIQGLSGEFMAEYHASQVTPYARQDSSLVTRIDYIHQPMLAAEDLLRVQELEMSVIPVVLEMERNAAIIDVEKLNRWVMSSERELHQLLMQLVKLTGWACSPTKPGDMARLFEERGLLYDENGGLLVPLTETGKPSFTEEVRARAAKKDPVIALAHRIIKLNSLRSKYLVSYARCVDYKGRLRSSFHQLRADEGGTVSGRFSSSAPIKDDPTSGVNQQQVSRVEKQLEAYCDPCGAHGSTGGKVTYDYHVDAGHPEAYVIRDLYIPGEGLCYASDADQIEFRLFAHYSGSKHLTEEYRKNPKVDFHEIVRDIIRKVRPETTRKLAKDCNFAKIYGAGKDKVAAMLGMTAADAAPFVEAYDEAFPEVAMLMKKAMSNARARGWVRTMTGRRARFPTRQFLHSALNRVIQGSAADINKRKLVELYRERKRLGITLRMTVHDEVVGDVPDVEAARRCDEVLNAQTTPTSVPILWSGNTGPNWRACK